jgi:hypothetical protein
MNLGVPKELENFLLIELLAGFPKELIHGIREKWVYI